MQRQFRMLGLVIGVLWGDMRTTQACGLDGIPSLQVNGRLVLLNHAHPTPGRLAAWAPFVAPGVYSTGRPIVLREMRGRVLWTLPPSAFKTPWRWTFGDGTQARGFAVAHVYRHAGTYVVGVKAYLIDGKDSQWYVFDMTVIHAR